MGNVLGFEQWLAERMHAATEAYWKSEGSRGLERDDDVTRMRHTLNVANAYRTERSWSDLWERRTVEGHAKNLRRASRFNTSRPDGSADVYGESVDAWEERLCNHAETGALDLARGYVARGRDVRDRVRALELEHGITLDVIAAYTGRPAAEFAQRDATYVQYAGERAECGPDSLLAFLREHRPTL